MIVNDEPPMEISRKPGRTGQGRAAGMHIVREQKANRPVLPKQQKMTRS